MASESPTISIKLLIDQERNKVVLAEAGSDFVDTLRYLLKFPLGSIAWLINKHQSLQPGCLNNLYNSVEDLSLNNFRTNVCKHMLLYPKSIHEGKSKNLKLNMDDATEPPKYFVCQTGCFTQMQIYVSYYSKTIRCRCGKLMNSEISVEGHKRDAVIDETEGLLHNVESMFFVNDDLRVIQGFPGDLIQILLSFGIKNLNQIAVKVLEIGPKEMVNLLSHSLISKTTLTDAFLRKQNSTLMHDEQVMLVAPDIKETTENDVKTRVKIMLRKSDRKILHAEATNNFVDLLFSFLTIPLESVLELIGGKGNLTVGSISNLYRDLSTTFSMTLQSNSQKCVLPPFYSCPNEFPNICSQQPPAFNYYYNKCTATWCFPSDNHKKSDFVPVMLDPKSLNPNTTNSSGYVNDMSLFVVTDGLVVKSLASLSSISLLQELDIPLDDVEEQVISIGEAEALALLRACLCSSSPFAAILLNRNVSAKQPKQEP